MKTTMKAAILLLTTLLISTSQVVLADDLVEDCSAEIDAVRTELDIGFCVDNLARHKFGEKICNGLYKKLDDADSKIEQHKFEDAEAKLAGFRKTLDSLAFRAKPIIDPSTEYPPVNDELVTAETCVEGL